MAGLFLQNYVFTNAILLQINTTMTDCLYQLKVTFTNHECEYIKQHIKTYFRKVKRYEPTLQEPHVQMTIVHKLIQFNATKALHVNAY